MYGPAPSRPKKTGISRSRTGCKGCRQRRTKCDEQKPSCGTCVRLGKPCEKTSPRLQFLTVVTGERYGIPKKSPVAGRLRLSGGDSAVFRQSSPNEGMASSILAIQSSMTDPGYDTSCLQTLRAVAMPTQPPKSVHPSPDLRQVTGFYNDIWIRDCLPAMHSTFRRMGILAEPASPLTGAIVSLAACRLSRARPQRKLFSDAGTAAFSFRPDAGHENVSHQHYGAVMRRIAGWREGQFKANPTLALALLVFFCYLESSMGNFRQFRVHSEGIRRLLRTCGVHLPPPGSDLLAAWAEIEAQNWWRRVYFSTSEFHRVCEGLAVPPEMKSLLNSSYQPRATVLLIMCESHRLSNVIHWAGFESLRGEKNVDGISNALPCDSEHEKERPGLEDVERLLEVESHALDYWLRQLPESALPSNWTIVEEYASKHISELEIRPLNFRSHASAMDFAYYVTARIMQSTGTCQSPEQAANRTCSRDGVEYWVSILLRIAAGIDWESCLHLNVFTIGFAGLLLSCALRTRDGAKSLWMQDWLERRLNGDQFEEGNFPVFQTLEALRLVNAERLEGRDVTALFQTVNDRGGSGKLASYHSQRLASLWVIGRWRSTGEVYAYQKAL